MSDDGKLPEIVQQPDNQMDGGAATGMDPHGVQSANSFNE